MNRPLRRIGFILLAWLVILACVPLSASAASGATGTLNDANGDPVKNTWLAVSNTGNGEETNLWVNSNGSFDISGLSAGDYVAVKYWDEEAGANVYLKDTFTIEAGGTSIPDPLELSAQMNTLYGDFGASHPTLAGWLSVVEEAPNGKSYDIRVKNGAFGAYLPTGNYVAAYIWDDVNDKSVKLNVDITIPLTEPLHLSIPADNLTGMLKKGDAPVVGAWLNFYNEDTLEGYGVRTDENGAFGLALPEGDYLATGYWMEDWNRFEALSEQFSVIAGSNTLEIEIPESNVTGTLTDEDGDPIAQAWLNLASGEDGNYFSVQVRAGAFDLYLPNGTYTLDGYWTNDDYYRLNQSLIVDNGSAEWTIASPKRNVDGTLQSADGGPVDNVWLSIQSSGSNGHFEAYVNNGAFKVYLPNGNYRVNGYWDPEAQEYVQLDKSFTVDGATALSLKALAKNVTGVLTQGGAPIGNVWLQIRTTSYSKYYTARVAADGRFAVGLPDGSYVIDGYSSDNGPYIRLNLSMGAVSGTKEWEVALPAPNIHGTLHTSNGTPIDGTYININRLDGNRAWYEAFVTNGNFELNLPDGSYRISSYYDSQRGDQVVVDYGFIVANGTATAGELTVVVPAMNVTGELKRADGTPVANVWLSIRTSDYQKAYSVKVQQDGTFSLALQDGTYNVDGYFSDSYQSYTRIDKDYVVTGETHWKITAPNDNVNGVLTALQGATIPRVLQLHLMQVKDTGWYGYTIRVENGSFQTALPDGHYILDGFSSEVDGVYTAFNFKWEFDIAGQTDLNIPIPAANVTGTFTNQQGELVNGSLRARRTGQQDSQTVNVQNGKFNAYLAPGAYELDYFFDVDAQKSYMLDRSINVTGDLQRVELKLPALNVHGRVSFRNSEASTNSLSVHIRKVTPNNNADTIQVDVDAGRYTVALADGEYEVISYYSRETNEFLSVQNLRFTVSGDTIYDIVLPTVNLTGTAYKAGGLEKYTSGYVVVLNEARNHSYWIWIGSDGSFRYILPDGRYTIEEIVEDGSGRVRSRVNPVVTVTIADGIANVSNINLVGLGTNVQGVVRNSNGELVPYNGTVGIQSIVQGGPSMSYYATVHNGSFQASLPDGKYKVQELFNQAGNEPFSSDAFDVVGGVASVESVVVAFAEKNVSGIVSSLAPGGAPFNGRIVFLRAENQGQSYSSVYSVPVVNGSFSAGLPDGYYLIAELSTDSSVVTLVNPNMKFTVDNGVPSINRIDLQYVEINTFGSIVYSDGQPVSGGRVIILRELLGGTEDRDYLMKAEGRFEAALLPGEYRVMSYIAPDDTSYIITEPAFTVELGNSVYVPMVTLPDTIYSGELVTSDGQPYMTRVEMFMHRDTENGSSPNFRFSVANGSFRIALPDGMYVITGYHDHGTYQYVSLPEPFRFTVTDGELSQELRITKSDS